MPIFKEPLPLSLYIHLPWCVKKCPYCDFNSHQAPAQVPEAEYIAALIDEMQMHQALVGDRSVQSIFFGGGTPSLFSANGIAKILTAVSTHFKLDQAVEITLEANPGTVDESKFAGFFQAGVNRLSIGIQSFNDTHLKKLGRIHASVHAKRAIQFAKNAGFTNFNIDLMHGLPAQTVEQALNDLHTALSFDPPHLSWYQLTLEPNTLFHHQPPELPSENVMLAIQEQGLDVLQQAGLLQYEISAYAKPSRQCQHNLNYWQYGDYLGLGAGAHSKITHGNQALRFAQVKHPKDYLNAEKRNAIEKHVIDEDNLLFEFMLNGMRLIDGVTIDCFEKNTGLIFANYAQRFQPAIDKKLLQITDARIVPTSLGRNFANDLMALFLPPVSN